MERTWGHTNWKYFSKSEYFPVDGGLAITEAMIRYLWTLSFSPKSRIPWMTFKTPLSELVKQWVNNDPQAAWTHFGVGFCFTLTDFGAGFTAWDAPQLCKTSRYLTVMKRNIIWWMQCIVIETKVAHIKYFAKLKCLFTHSELRILNGLNSKTHL